MRSSNVVTSRLLVGPRRCPARVRNVLDTLWRCVAPVAVRGLSMRPARIALLVVFTLVAVPGFAQIQKPKINETYYYPPAFQTPQIAPEIPFDMPDPNYFVLPGEMQFGEISSVTTNSKGHVFILSRSNAKGDVHGGSATQVFEFDEKGKYVKEWGHDLYGFAYGHGIRVDKDDNLWVVDKGTDMVIKFNKTSGKVMMVLGRREEATTKYWLPPPAGEAAARPRPGFVNGEEDGGFKEPTDVAWDSQGNIYVSDGYVHSRVAKFDKYGTWIGTWGHKNTTKNGEVPLPGEFSTVHNIQVDKYDHVWVADRSNGRAQVFDTEGNFLREVIINVPVGHPGGYQPLMGHQMPPEADNKQGGELRPGTPDALCIPPDNPNVIFFADVYPGRVYKVNITDGKVLGWFGHVGRRPGEMGAVHGLACPSENLIYTAEFVAERTQRWVLHPDKAQTASKENPTTKGH
jgi:sugar lactone lactonase YvrE